MSVENIFCNMELHGGKGFQPPPAAPQASLERASHLAKASLMRRSQLGRTSNLGRTSERIIACTEHSIAAAHDAFIASNIANMLAVSGFTHV
jgi:hypothetical protein